MNSRQHRKRDHLIGWLLTAITGLVVLSEFFGAEILATLSAVLAFVLLVLMSPGIERSRHVFLAVALAMSAATIATRADSLDQIKASLNSAAFIIAVFIALGTLRNASQTSKAMRRCGSFLAQQPPGRRYLALTIGGHIFSIILTYGAVSFLGHLAEANAKREPDPEIRAHRLRRMLLAINRGLASMMAWSPLSLAIVLTTTLIPGGTWSGAALPCIISAFLMAGIGWGLDTIFKPKLSTGPRPPALVAPPKDGWSSVLPLAFLLLALTVGVVGLHLLTGVRSVGAVMVVVPLLSVGWIAAQGGRARWFRKVRIHLDHYVRRELPQFRSDLVLIMMAGYIGLMGSMLLSPVIRAAGIDFHAWPAGVLLVSVIWLLPLLGQLGMHPIMSVTLIAPLVPNARDLGIDPGAVIAALTVGWALATASSPYTATSVLIARMGKVSPYHVGLVWNGPYTVLCAVALSIVVVAFAWW